MSDETAAGLLDAELATSKGPQPGDGITGAVILWSFCLEQSQHPLRTVRRPHGDDPPVSFAQCLRRTHTQILPRVSALAASMPDRLDAAGGGRGSWRPRTGVGSPSPG